jgi:signal transduction histidine kinase
MRGLPKGRLLPYRSSAFDVVLAVALAMVGILDALRSGSWPQPYVVSAALVAFSALCLAWRRRPAAGLEVHLHTQGPTRPLPAAVELNAYRVLQEGLTNALKHAGHAKVNVVLHYQPSNLEIEIVDDGRATQRGNGGRHGIPGLRERVAVFGGRFEAGSQPEGGWRISASFPTTS